MTESHCAPGRLTGTPARGTPDLTLGRASQGALPSGVSGRADEAEQVAEGCLDGAAVTGEGVG